MIKNQGRYYTKYIYIPNIHSTYHDRQIKSQKGIRLQK